MNWKSPSELRWMAESLRGFADELDAAADQMENLTKLVVREPIETPIEEGDRANG